MPFPQAAAFLGQQGPCSEPRTFPVLERKLAQQGRVGHPQPGLDASFHAPLSPIAPGPATASAPGYDTLTEIVGTGVKQAGVPSWLHYLYVNYGTLVNN